MNLFQRILLPTFVLSIVIYVLHVTALKFYFYWTYWWFDILLHSLTGFVLALLIVFLIYRIYPLVSEKKIFLFTTVIVFLVAVSWEVFEYVNGFALTEGSYILDTISDVILGVGAGYIAVRYVVALKKK